jgi:hypothetical protein
LTRKRSTKFCPVTLLTKNTRDVKITNGKPPCPAKKRTNNSKIKHWPGLKRHVNTKKLKNKEKRTREFGMKRKNSKVSAGPKSKKKRLKEQRRELL